MTPPTTPPAAQTITQPSAKLETCPLCGAKFDATAEGCRRDCPLSRGCSLVCCPHCSYGFPRERGLAGLLRKWLERKKT